MIDIRDVIDAPVTGDQMAHLLAAVRQRGPGHVLEFGVMSGRSLRAIAGLVERIYGFDTFTGLPEPWDKNEAGVATHTAANHAVPNWRSLQWPANSELFEGLFSDTLPRWLAAHDGPVGFAHIDCDIYSSTRDVLFLLDDRLVEGSVLVFDELYPFRGNYPRWAFHEWRALTEWLKERGRRVAPISRSDWEQAAFRVVA